MGRGSQRKGTLRSSNRDWPAPIVCGQQRSCLLPKKPHALTIFGSLVKQRFVNSTIFTLAGTFLKRVKQYFQTGWKLKQYLPLMRHSSDGMSNSFMPRSSGCAVDFNANAKTHKRPNKTRPVGRPRRTVAVPVEKPRNKQNDKPKHDRCLRSDVSCKASKKTPHRVQKSASSRTGDKIVQQKISPNDHQLSVAAQQKATNLHEGQQSQQIKFTACSNFGQVSTSENVHSSSRADNIPELMFESGLNNETQQQTKPKQSTRLKLKASLNVKDVNPKKDVRLETLDMRSLSLQHISKGIRPKQESKNCVASLHSKVWQSNLSYNSSPQNINEWPSLAESGRRKSLMKEAAKEVVRRKYAGSGGRDAGFCVRNSGLCDLGSDVGVMDTGCSVRDAGSGVRVIGTGIRDARSGVSDAGMLLKDVNYVESEQSDANVDMTESFSRTVQQTCSSTANHRTWAYVAAQSLAGTVSDQRPSETYQTSTGEPTEHTPTCSSYSSVSLLKIRKPPIRSKLAHSVRLSGDHSKISEKPTLGKFMAERQQILKTIRGKNKLAKHVGEKDQSEKIRSRKVERSDDTHENVAHLLGTHKPKSCWEHIWTVDDMPMVYSAEQQFSECDNRESQLTAGSCHSRTNLSVVADSELATVDVHGSMSNNTKLLSDNIQSDSSVEQHGELVVASYSSCSSLGIKNEISETEAKSPKKVSARYRALLRNDSSRMTAKTLTEMQSRNKKTNHLHDNKVATRERQRQQRQERQTTRHDAVRFHTSACSQDPNQSCQEGRAQITCPYWLRSKPASQDLGYMDTPGNMQSNNENDQKDECFEDSNKATLTPSRRSERLRGKAKNGKSTHYLRCLCLHGTGH